MRLPAPKFILRQQSVMKFSSFAELKNSAVHIDLEWGGSDQAAGYVLVVAADAGFTRPLERILLRDHRFKFENKGYETLYFKVAAAGAGGERISPFSRILKKDLKLAMGVQKPTLRAFNSLHRALHWSDSSTATQYQVQVAADLHFQRPVINASASTNSYPLARPLRPGRYYWRVKGKNGPLAGEWSETGVFQIK
jgi:hypothetical protein